MHFVYIDIMVCISAIYLYALHVCTYATGYTAAIGILIYCILVNVLV